PVAFHLQPCFTEGAIIWAKGFGLLLIARVNRNERFTFHLFDNEGVKLPFIVSSVCNKEAAGSKAVNTLELGNEPACDLCVRSFVWQRDRHQWHSFFRDND